MGGIPAYISLGLDGIPVVRRFWRWLWERDMEVGLREPHSQVVRGADGLNKPDEATPILSVHVGESPHFYMWADLVLTNHRTARREVIADCELHLKRRHWLIWRKTIACAPVLLEQRQGSSFRQVAWKPLTLRPITPPVVFTVQAESPITYPIASLPRKMWLVLEFAMVGPRRRMRREVEKIIHDPRSLTLFSQR